MKKTNIHSSWISLRELYPLISLMMKRELGNRIVPQCRACRYLRGSCCRCVKVERDWRRSVTCDVTSRWSLAATEEDYREGSLIHLDTTAQTPTPTTPLQVCEDVNQYSRNFNPQKNDSIGCESQPLPTFQFQCSLRQCRVDEPAPGRIFCVKFGT